MRAKREEDDAVLDRFRAKARERLEAKKRREDEEAARAGAAASVGNADASTRAVDETVAVVNDTTVGAASMSLAVEQVRP